MPWLVLLVGLAALLALGAQATDGPPAPLSSPTVDPLLQRVEVAADGRRALMITITSLVDAKLLAIETDCRCLVFAQSLPLALGAGQRVELPCTAVGVLQGLKTVVFRTTAGDARAQVHVVSPGLGEGVAILRQIAERCRAERLAPWFLVHNLKGRVRNCGCSSGSLGGIDHLAALPAAWAMLAPGISPRFILSGDSDGMRGGVGDALAAHGWTRADGTTVVATDDPVPAIGRAETVVVLASRRPVNHRKLVTPLLDGGAVVEVALVGPEGVREVLHLPVDATLPVEPAILAGFARPLTATVQPDANPSATCLACHGAAHATWAASRHAHAWTSLKAADQTDDCVACHSTPIAERALAPGVHCHSCHSGAEAHAAAGGTVRTTGTTDCRGCHDSRHHPSFTRSEAWRAIAH